MSQTRLPAATPASISAAARLRADVQGFLDEAEAVAGREIAPRRARGIVVPHAPLGLAGPTAAVAFASVRVPATCVLLAPADDVRGASDDRAALLPGPRATPLGELPADRALADALLRAGVGLVAEDAAARPAEHVLDTVLPFLQLRAPEASVVTVLLPWDVWQPAEHLARAVAAAIGGRDDVLVVAASNMNRGEGDETTRDKDALALAHVVALDGAALLDAVRAEGISMSGASAVACACEVARLRGARAGELVAYSHSGIVTGDPEGVTGYAAVLLGAG